VYANLKPVGIICDVTTTSASSGSGNSLTITLRHQPSKNDSGISGGDITNAGGTTDLEATFPVTIN